MRRRLVAWVLVVVVVLCSCAFDPVCSWRPLDGDDATGAASVDAKAGGGGGGKSTTVWNRRSLGDRSTWLPPSPLWNDRRSTGTPPPSSV